MAFFMPVLKNNKLIFICKNWLISIIMLISFLFPFAINAKNIDIISTNMYLANEVYYLDASLDIQLTEEAKKALRHGIALEIHTEFQLLQIREWFWDKKMDEVKLTYRLEHQPLTENYLTIDLKTGLRRSYHTLSSALFYLNNIKKITLFNKNILDNNKPFMGRIRTFLDIESLPTPIRPQAYFSAHWEISSDWYEWDITQ